jgi:hypothetical protein
MASFEQEREGRDKRRSCEMLCHNGCSKASAERELKEMSMVHPKGTVG